MATGNRANLAAVREQLRQQWPEADYCRQKAVPGFRIPLLAQLAPEADFNGQLVEICGGVSSGKTTLLYRLLAGIESPTVSAYFDFDHSFFPAAAQAAGIQLDHLLLLRPADIPRALRAAEQILTAQLARCLVFDLANVKEPLPHVLLHRLRQHLNRRDALLLLLTSTNHRLLPASAVSLRLQVSRPDDGTLQVEVLRSRVSPEGIKLEVRDAE